MSLLLERSSRGNALLNSTPIPEAPEDEQELLEPADPWMDLKLRVHERLIRELDVTSVGSWSDKAVRTQVEDACRQLLLDEDVPLARDDRLRLVSEITDEVVGLGPIQPLLDDPTVSEVMVSGPTRVYFERAGVLHASHRVFKDDAHIMRIIEKIVAPVNR